jgi:cytochrome b
MVGVQLSGGAVAPPGLWDPVVRVSHWGIALAVLLNAVLTEGGSLVHIWTGWSALGLLLIRVLWGFVGPREARFSAFPPHPAGALSHMRDLARRRPGLYASHNPAGAMMAYVMWAALAVVIGTGIAMTGTGPFGALERKAAVETQDWSTLDLGESRGEEEDEALEEVHEMAGNLLLILAALHVGGVALESLVMRRNLVRPMLGGARRE